MRQYEVKETAKIIRESLRVAFPKTKFSVRLDRYSMGHSVDVGWIDGPTDGQVKRILDRFTSHGFDGMTDCSYYCGKRMYKGEHVNMDGGYVRGSRHTSKAVLLAVADRVAYECGTQPPEVKEHTGKDGYAYLAGDFNQRVPFQWHSHWIDSEKEYEERRKYIGMADITGPGHLLAHDSHEGEYLTRLIDRIAQYVSMEEQQPVELPEYIDEKATVETGRTADEPKQRMFPDSEAVRAEERAIAEFEGAIIAAVIQ